MTDSLPGPASHVARRHPGRMSTRGPRPYPPLGSDAEVRDVALAAVRALVHAPDEATVRQVIATVVGDLGGAVVPARFEPEAALPLDVSLGLGEPTLVVVEPLSVAALGLREVLPALLDDARAVLARLPADAGAERPTGAEVDPGDLDRFVALLATGDGVGARGFVSDLVRRGVDPADVVEQVLAPAQREVGDRWYRGVWSIGDEHAATGVSEGALAVLSPRVQGRAVLFAAPEGEWHALPARMAAAAAPGVAGRVLGPGLPAEHLRRYLELHEPELLALSCTMPTNLIAAARSIEAAHAAGVPVVAGGRAFGTDPARALRLGADAWAASAAEIGDLHPVIRRSAVPVPHEAVEADVVPDEVLVLALERQAGAGQWVRAMDERQRRHSLEDLRWLARYAAAALACDDPTVLDELLGWLEPLMSSRGVPASVLPDGVRYLADAMEPRTPSVADLLRGAADRLG